jgi:DNA polymerase-3 subunit chi
VLDIFDGRNEEAVSQARKRWVSYKAAGHELTYLKQTETGGWQQPSQQ